MDLNEINERLRALACDDMRRSEIARLRDVYDNVEAALQAGVKQADVLSELREAGFNMTIATFKSALQRIRKQRLASKTLPTKAAAKATGRMGKAVATGAKITNPSDVRQAAHNRDIDLSQFENSTEE